MWQRLGIFAVVCSIVVAGVAFADEVVAAAAPALFSSEFWKVVGTGLLSGLMASFVGLLKSKGLADFDFQKSLPALAIGALVGAVAGYKGMTFADTESWLTTLPLWAGLTAFIEMAIKAVWRKGTVAASSDPK